jgi:hypothetical protein
MYTPEYKTKVEVQHTAYIEQFTGNRTHHFFLLAQSLKPPITAGSGNHYLQSAVRAQRYYGEKINGIYLIYFCCFLYGTIFLI